MTANRNRAGVPAMRKDPFARLVVALLRPRRGTGGWVRVEDLATEVGVAKSTVRRQLESLEAAGFPIEHHAERPGVARRHALGVRSLLVGRRLDADPDPSRWSTREAVPRQLSGRIGPNHPWRTAFNRSNAQGVLP